VEGDQPNHRAQLVQFLRGLWPARGPPHGKLEAYPTGLTLTGVETARTFASLTVVGGRPQPVFFRARAQGKCLFSYGKDAR
jgi:hypothetical protein